MKLRAERRIVTFLLIILIVNIQLFLCQEDNSSQDKIRDKVRKLSKNKEKLNKYKQIKPGKSTETFDSDDDDINDTTTYRTTNTTTRLLKTSEYGHRLGSTSVSSTTRRTTFTTVAPEPEPELEPEANNEEKLMEYLLSRRRNKNSRPKKIWTDPVTVKIGMALIHLGRFLTALMP